MLRAAEVVRQGLVRVVVAAGECWKVKGQFSRPPIRSLWALEASEAQETFCRMRERKDRRVRRYLFLLPAVVPVGLERMMAGRTEGLAAEAVVSRLLAELAFLVKASMEGMARQASVVAVVALALLVRMVWRAQRRALVAMGALAAAAVSQSLMPAVAVQAALTVPQRALSAVLVVEGAAELLAHQRRVRMGRTDLAAAVEEVPVPRLPM